MTKHVQILEPTEDGDEDKEEEMEVEQTMDLDELLKMEREREKTEEIIAPGKDSKEVLSHRYSCCYYIHWTP